MSQDQQQTTTPGPWVIFHADGVSSVMPAMRPGEIATGITNEADARLIAVAPDLLAACKLAVAAMGNKDAARHIEAVIARAEGRRL